MLNRNFFCIYPLFIVFILIGTSACQKKTDVTPTNGQLELVIQTYVSTSKAVAGTVYTTADGRKMSISKTQFYLSNIGIQREDGTWFYLPNEFQLVTTGVDSYNLLTKVPPGNYQSINFNVGLDATTNTYNPNANDALFYRPDMWLDSTAAQPNGYVYFNFQGAIDTTANKTGTKLTPFVYKLGTASSLRSVTLPIKAFSVTPDNKTSIVMAVDYSKFFTGIDLRKPSYLTIDNLSKNNSSVILPALVKNIPLMFTYK